MTRTRSSARAPDTEAGADTVSDEMQKIRWALIGAGNIAQVAVLPAFAHATETCELVAIVSSDPEKKAKLSAKYSVEHVGDYDELEAVLEAADVDAAYIALPNHLHRAFTERCAAVGVHVLCEKPMAPSVEDCLAMMHACDAAGVQLMIAYRLHFEEASLKALETVRDGRLGELSSFSSVFSHDVVRGDVRTQQVPGAGALFDLGPYCVNAARTLFGDEPTEVFGWQVNDGAVDVMTTALLKFPGDRLAQFTVNQGAAAVSELRIVGSKGDLRLDPAYEYVKGLKEFLTLDEQTKQKSYEARDQFAPELIYFARCLLDGEEPEPSGEEGLCDVRVLTAIVQSASTGKAVPLAPFERKQHLNPDEQLIKKPKVRKVKPVNAPSPSR